MIFAYKIRHVSWESSLLFNNSKTSVLPHVNEISVITETNVLCFFFVPLFEFLVYSHGRYSEEGHNYFVL